MYKYSQNVYLAPASRKRSRFALLVFLVAITGFLGFWLRSSLNQRRPSIPSDTFSLSPDFLPANSTLGFGAVLVVSPLDSPRRYSLLQAANVTEIDLTIPDLPVWTEEDEARFRSAGPPTEMTKGMIFAWMSHLHVLEWFLSSGLETALILEDDMDWDQRLRSVQIPRAASSFRSLFNTTTTSSSPSSPFPSPSPSSYYYGSPSDWDILYLGHFDRWAWPGQSSGVGYQTPSDLATVPHRLFADATLPPRFDMHPRVASLLTALDVAPATRVIHRAKVPLGSWAYAVTRASAARIVSAEVAAPGAPKWVADSLDSALVRACAAALRCWSVFPEVFHHREGEGSSMIDYKEQRGAGLEDYVATRQRERTGETDQIGCGFASGELDWGEDLERLERLKEGGRRGVCLKEGRRW